MGAAVKKIPEALLQQLNENGLMIAPIGGEFSQKICIIRKDDRGKVAVEEELDVRYVPLTDRTSQEAK